MVTKKPDIVDDIINAGKLEERMRQRLADNAMAPPATSSWLDRRLDLPTFVLAVIGAVACIVGIGAALFPLAAISWAYWFA